MSSAPEVVGDLQLSFFFQTNEPIPAKALMDFVRQVDRVAHFKKYLGPTAIVELLEIRTGTKLIIFSFSQAESKLVTNVAIASFVVGVLALGNDLRESIKETNSPIANSVATMCLDHGVVNMTVTTSAGRYLIDRDEVSMVADLRDQRISSEDDGSEAWNISDSITPDLKPRPTSREEIELDPSFARLGQPSVRRIDGKVYTVFGSLTSPGAKKSQVPLDQWQFTSQSGKVFIATGVRPDRVGTIDGKLVAIRAEVAGKKDGYTTLDVKDVFEPEEP